jgi:hypothetical protein
MISFAMVFAATVIRVVPAGVVMIAPMATTVIDYWRCSIVTGRFIYHRRGRCPPAKRVDTYADVYVGVGDGACHERKRDNAK